MKEFIEKWNEDQRFKTKVKLGTSSLFVLLVAVFAVTSNGVNSVNNTSYIDENNNIIEETNDKNEQESSLIKIPEEYSYTNDIMINNEKYSYIGEKTKERETITKISNGINTDYIYQEENYYKKENNEYILTSKEDIYDIINNNYLKLETINQYLTKSIKQEESNIVKLKDIILGTENEGYITITLNNNQIKIDYTSLIKEFDKSIENCIVEIIIEEIE